MFDFSTIGIKPGYSTGYKPGVTDDQISTLEKFCGHELPDNYIFYLKNYHGGYLEAKDFSAYDEDVGISLGYELRNFFIIDEHTDRPLNIWWVIEKYSKLMDPGTLPFAEDGYSPSQFQERFTKNYKIGKQNNISTTLLHIAAKNGHLPFIEAIKLNCGAELQNQLNKQDHYGNTRAHIAAHNNRH